MQNSFLFSFFRQPAKNLTLRVSRIPCLSVSEMVRLFSLNCYFKHEIILHIMPSWLTCCFSTTESTSELAFRFLSVAWWKLCEAWGVGRLKDGRSWDFLKKLVNNLLPWSEKRSAHYQINTVEPLLSGRPRGNSNWPLNRGWLLNRGLSEISMRPFIKVTLLQYKIT